ncbi:hypothetical protein BO82DRAFT_435770 [Aspergillus uvarum CBS 121591]|uniref:Uncharacterized protein n=1 Tax=Aspergillus uvarum CBS 121591 TaxID=1448315 RepID=A0A319DCE5_9EURO|nr:hypothetical protein BO82DRAFT_435770 [Aspergillus uvarum CBS 121591]PYH77512.1 hypothetical protein BO82DRAFT_435770 [Aspergillus uvarum CBS 121591]
MTKSGCGCLLDYRFLASWVKHPTSTHRKHPHWDSSPDSSTEKVFFYYVVCMAILLCRSIRSYFKIPAISSPGRGFLLLEIFPQPDRT